MTLQRLRYDETHGSWEPYANLRDSEQLHACLPEKNLQRVIIVSVPTLSLLIWNPMGIFFLFLPFLMVRKAFRKFLVSKSLTYLALVLSSSAILHCKLHPSSLTTNFPVLHPTGLRVRFHIKISSFHFRSFCFQHLNQFML